jgi:hypothetical protein
VARLGTKGKRRIGELYPEGGKEGEQGQEEVKEGELGKEGDKEPEKEGE